MVNADQLKIAINAAVESLKTRFAEIVNDLEKSLIEKLTEVYLLSKDNEKKINDQNNSITDLNNKFDTLLNEQKDLQNKYDVVVTKLGEQEKATNALVERLEERTNRTLRKTLIFKGVDDDRNESWKDTEVKLTNILVSNMNISPTRARNMIERAHRGRRSEVNPNAPRPIYAAIFNWKDAEYIKESFRELNFRDRTKSFPYSVDQMYGPLTTRRRHHALMIRKELKNNGTIVSGFVKYPAKR